MDAINTTLKCTKQELQRKFAPIIMRLTPEKASEARETVAKASAEQLRSRKIFHPTTTRRRHRAIRDR
jgi:hypothetical protein